MARAKTVPFAPGFHAVGVLLASGMAPIDLLPVVPVPPPRPVKSPPTMTFVPEISKALTGPFAPGFHGCSEPSALMRARFWRPWPCTAVKIPPTRTSVPERTSVRMSAFTPGFHAVARLESSGTAPIRERAAPPRVVNCPPTMTFVPEISKALTVPLAPGSHAVGVLLVSGMAPIFHLNVFPVPPPRKKKAPPTMTSVPEMARAKTVPFAPGFHAVGVLLASGMAPIDLLPVVPVPPPRPVNCPPTITSVPERTRALTVPLAPGSHAVGVLLASGMAPINLLTVVPVPPPRPVKAPPTMTSVPEMARAKTVPFAPGFHAVGVLLASGMAPIDLLPVVPVPPPRPVKSPPTMTFVPEISKALTGPFAPGFHGCSEPSALMRARFWRSWPCTARMRPPIMYPPEGTSTQAYTSPSTKSPAKTELSVTLMRALAPVTELEELASVNDPPIMVEPSGAIAIELTCPFVAPQRGSCVTTYSPLLLGLQAEAFVAASFARTRKR